MTLVEALVLGIVQGLTELLPVSSSGHLAIVPKVLGWDDPPLAFTVAVHMGTLVAIVIYLRRDLIEIVRGLWFTTLRGKAADPAHREQALLAGKLLISMVPAAIAGVLLEDVVEGAFGSIQFVGVFLIVTAAVLWGSERVSRRRKEAGTGRDEVTWLDAVLIGVAQACALFPGVSRSGTTIGAGLARGLVPDKAVRFAFLMSIPVVLGGGLFEGAKMARAGTTGTGLPLHVVGAVAAALSTWVAIVLVFGAVRRGKLIWFGVYCLLVGLGCVVTGFWSV